MIDKGRSDLYAAAATLTFLLTSVVRENVKALHA